jgi:uncharacterized protein YjbI with pentapeptide repeats
MEARAIDILRQGALAWNAWREAYPNLSPLLRGADLHGMDVSGADLRSADLREAKMCGADLRKVNFRDAQLSYSDLQGRICHSQR